MALLSRVGVDSVYDELFNFLSRKFTVIREFGNVIVDVALDLVREALSD